MHSTTLDSIPSAHSCQTWEYEALLELRKILRALREENRRTASLAADTALQAASKNEIDEEHPDILVELARQEAELAELDRTLNRLQATTSACAE